MLDTGSKVWSMLRLDHALAYCEFCFQNSSSFFTFRVSVCVCVCVCVCPCVCVLSTAQTDGPILIKLSTNYLLNICSIRFFLFWKFKFVDALATIFAVFECGTLTVAILLRFSSHFWTWKAYTHIFLQEQFYTNNEPQISPELITF